MSPKVGLLPRTHEAGSEFDEAFRRLAERFASDIKIPGHWTMFGTCSILALPEHHPCPGSALRGVACVSFDRHCEPSPRISRHIILIHRRLDFSLDTGSEEVEVFSV